MGLDIISFTLGLLVGVGGACLVSLLVDIVKGEL